MPDQLRIDGGTDEIRPADPAPATHEAPPLFEFPRSMRGQLPITAGPIRDLDAWAETVVPDA